MIVITLKVYFILIFCISIEISNVHKIQNFTTLAYLSLQSFKCTQFNL